MNKPVGPLPTIERLREAMDYDPATGIMTARIKRGNNSRIGERVGSDGGQGYLVVGLDRHRILLHRLAWAHYYGKWPTQFIDHIDGNGHNNAISNLRDVSARTNSANTRRSKEMRADAAKWRAYQASRSESLTVGDFNLSVTDAEGREWRLMPVEATQLKPVR